MLKIRVTRDEVTDRAQIVVRAICESLHWSENADGMSGLSWMERRELFRSIFDELEGGGAAGWLGVLESGTITAIEALGPRFSEDTATIGTIVAFVGHHPNVIMVE